MFGSANKVKIDPELLTRIKQIAEVAGYASHEEFDEAGSDADITEKLKGLGYIS
jgi:hypothetical protein